MNTAAVDVPRDIARGIGGRARERSFLIVTGGVFATSTAATILRCSSMAGMAAVPMPGGWSMSMAWMRMSGQSWSGAAAAFAGMWLVMMTAMMLPSFAPMLWRYRRSIANNDRTRPGRLAAVAGSAYFCVWASIGMAVYPSGVALAAAAMQAPSFARTLPFAAGTVVAVAGALQFTRWKAHHLAGCRGELSCRTAAQADVRNAWRHGLALGWHCVCSSAGLTAILLAIGVMDLRAMAVVTAAITAERLAPTAQRVAHATGAIAVVAGLLLIASASTGG